MFYKYISYDSVLLLNLRILFLLSAFVHLLVTAMVTLSIDTTVDDDPSVRAYYYIRWKLLTCWFNLITLLYLPATLYCSWRSKKGDGVRPEMMRLRRVTDTLMTGFIFPVTMFSDLMFWSMYLTDPALLGPPKIFEYLPYWAQHSLHTVSLVVVILDIILTPRRRPNSLKPRIAMMWAFTIIYTGMVYINYLRGEYVYAVCEAMNPGHFLCILLFAMAIKLALFYAQWMVIDFLWGTQAKKIE